MNYSRNCSIPSVKDVLEHPLSLFITSVVHCDDGLLERVDQNNYRSYIAALLKSGKDAKTKEAVDEVKTSALHLISEIHAKGVNMNQVDSESLSSIANLATESLHKLDYCIERFQLV